MSKLTYFMKFMHVQKLIFLTHHYCDKRVTVSILKSIILTFFKRYYLVFRKVDFRNVTHD